MKRKLIALSHRYIRALKEHLRQGARASLKPARELGRRAASLDLETLDVARIHEEALATLEASSSRDGIIERAELFFTEAITPIEKNHRAALKAKVHLDHVNKTLDKRTMDLATANQSLKRGIARRKTVERSLKKRGRRSQKLWEESRYLQMHLRRLTQQILTAQENKRKKMSRELQDEIAQTLLGINVRLLTLKKEALASAKGFKKEIASTQRLVDKAGKSIKRIAHEFGNQQEA